MKILQCIIIIFSTLIFLDANSQVLYDKDGDAIIYKSISLDKNATLKIKGKPNGYLYLENGVVVIKQLIVDANDEITVSKINGTNGLYLDLSNPYHFSVKRDEKSASQIAENSEFTRKEVKAAKAIYRLEKKKAKLQTKELRDLTEKVKLLEAEYQELSRIAIESNIEHKCFPNEN